MKKTAAISNKVKFGKVELSHREALELALALLLESNATGAADILCGLVGPDGISVAQQLAEIPNTTPAMGGGKPAFRGKPHYSKESPRLVVTLTPEEFHDVHNLAYKARSSVSQVVQLAVVRLLLDAEAGKLPLLPEFRSGIDPGHA